MHTHSFDTDLSLNFTQGGYSSEIVGFGTNLTGMFTIDSSDPLKLSWTNSTEASKTPSTFGARMEFLRYGSSDFLVSFSCFDVS